MADLTATALNKYQPRSGRRSYIIADGEVLAANALVQAKSGYLEEWDETGQFLGVFIGGEDRAADGVFTGETSDSPPPRGYVNESGVTMMHVAVASSTQANVGALVYCATGNIADATITDTTNPPVGRLVNWRSATDADVELFTPGEWLAGDAGAAWAS